jgi:hypothetical protein
MELYAPAAFSPRRKHLVPTAKEGDSGVSLEAVGKKEIPYSGGNRTTIPCVVQFASYSRVIQFVLHCFSITKTK